MRRQPKADGHAHIHVTDSRGASMVASIKHLELKTLHSILQQLVQGFGVEVQRPQPFTVVLTPRDRKNVKRLVDTFHSMVLHYQIDPEKGQPIRDLHHRY